MRSRVPAAGVVGQWLRWWPQTPHEWHLMLRRVVPSELGVDEVVVATVPAVPVDVGVELVVVGDGVIAGILGLSFRGLVLLAKGLNFGYKLWADA